MSNDLSILMLDSVTDAPERKESRRPDVYLMPYHPSTFIRILLLFQGFSN